MRHATRNIRAVFALATGLLAGGPYTAAAQTPITSEDMATFHPRSIGPAVSGGRVHDVEAVPSDPSTIYVASASGGLWKSTNRGMSWTNIFDAMTHGRSQNGAPHGPRSRSSRRERARSGSTARTRRTAARRSLPARTLSTESRSHTSSARAAVKRR